ncbi:acetolactate synthase large subunit [Orrella daihaiensis]|uniref:Acetolactate synthase large subunit n=1 Tax=Orrella daihaiensis TaxID=2782176 RepID=A0ABY4AH11_9BURK|nr:acetolactate synthase large subunit [Orrella daihaiensis]UOD49577.1 acetolactate synthase large subunit [Orrella daihaiensis]
MNGSQAMVKTLLAGSVDVCFANPGTSEMHFVAALDQATEMRCVLGLFEGVVTGAADGYYRMAGKPAATLLHLGPGLGNGLANLHNARKARSGIINVIGQHALDHIHNDAPLNSDVEGVARPMSNWVRTIVSSTHAAMDTAEAISQAKSAPGRIASLILPANCAWESADAGQYSFAAAHPPAAVLEETVDEVAALLAKPGTAKRVCLLLGGTALLESHTWLAGQIAAKTGCQLLSEPRSPRLQRGRGRVNVRPIPFAVDAAVATLKDADHIVLIGSTVPVAFFAYPGKPRLTVPANCHVHTLATPGHDLHAALQALCDATGAGGTTPAFLSKDLTMPVYEDGFPTPATIGAVLARALPENAIVVDEAVTSGRQLADSVPYFAPHDCIDITGGAIGFGLPAAVGAAVAAPGRRVVALVGDGSAMYTIQALWSMAREGLDVTVVIFDNRSYRILRGELNNMGGPAPGVNASRMLDLDGPELDWVSMAKAHGVPGTTADTLSGFEKALNHANATPGPSLIALRI